MVVSQLLTLFSIVPIMKKFLFAPLLAALAMFFWGFVYYGLSGIPYKVLGTVGDIGPELTKLFPADGTYILPDPRGTPEAISEQMKRGQFATVHIKKSGVPEMDPAVMGKGFALEFVTCLLLAFMVRRSGPVTGAVRRFLTGPVGCELTGATWTPDGRTLFVNIQHPGESPRDRNDPANPRRYSNWPDFHPDGRPRSATLVIRRNDGGVIGT